APLHDSEGVADGMGSRCASRHRTRIVSAESEVDRNLARCHVGDHHRHEERAHPSGPLFKECPAVLLQGVNPPNTKSDQHARTIAVDPIEINHSIFQYKTYNNNHKLDKPI